MHVVNLCVIGYCTEALRKPVNSPREHFLFQSFHLFSNIYLNNLKKIYIYNLHVATLIGAGCIAYNKIQQNILLKSGK